jgi:hypothetical protein
MLKAKQKTDLASRILSLQAECERLIDEEAERQAVPGVPTSSIRNLLIAHWPGNPFMAALAILQNERN